ncbi:hypothetical protein M2390_002999 [Mycetocola sp. BIGb0189]|uniref:DUF3054 domain-containing protein n=1 Tax=Mycetocola sp. BIGb0189 TaxID=2940604 RepID=UPI002168552E|nr:DUF3054 domain-containing protein [Mycetocola sp. BIGb0189]MCS4277784.1 hypothetical protein [Mycetocola sp. BIGb0189]
MRFGSSPTRSIVSAAALDALLIIVFVMLGRRSHAEGNDLLGILGTAWPFLVGAAIGWIVTLAWRNPVALRWTGPLIWLATVVLGLPLRVLAGGEAPISFVLVTAGVLAIFLIGWRALALLLMSRRGRRTARR